MVAAKAPADGDEDEAADEPPADEEGEDGKKAPAFDKT